MLVLSTAGCRAEISPAGAELTRLSNSLTGQEYLWNADPAVWGRHAPVLFPIVGRLPDDTYLHRGRSYRLGQHGFARDAEFTVLHQSDTDATLELRDSTATRAVYPFAFVLTITYALLHNTLHVMWQVQNPADASEALLFSIGAHPAFRCPLRPEQDEKFDDYAFRFDHPTSFGRQLLRGGMRTGLTAPVLHEAATLPLTYELFADDALVLAHFDFTRLALQATSGTGPFVRLEFVGFPYLGLWTKGPEAAFVCIEPWHGVASPVGPPQELADKEGILTLEAGQVFEAQYSITVG